MSGMYQTLQVVSKAVQSNLASRIRDLHDAKGRAANNAFIVEGRKNIEHFLLKGYDPIFICSSLKVATRFSEILHEGNSAEREPTRIASEPSQSHASNPLQLTNNTRMPMVGPAPPRHHQRDVEGWKVFRDTVSNPLRDSYWNESQHGFQPPLVPESLLKLSPESKKAWLQIFPKVVVVHDGILGRTSQHTTPPRFLAVFPLLPTIACLRATNGIDYHKTDELADTHDYVLETNRFKTPPNAFANFWAEWLNNSPDRSAFYSYQKHPLYDPYASADHLVTYNAFLNTKRLEPPPSYEHIIPEKYHRSRQRWDWRKGGLILAGLSDPGNAGTLIRTAVALNIKQIVVIDGVDVYSHKVIQSTAGAIADANIVTCSGRDFVEFIRLCREAKAEKSRAAQRDASIVELKEGTNGESEEKTNSEVSEDGKSKSENTSSDASDADSVPDEVQELLESLSGVEPYLAALVPTRGFDIESMPDTLEEVSLRVMMAEEILEDRDGLVDPVNPADFEIDEHLKLYFQETGRKPWLVVGSEAHGIPGQIQELCQVDVTIRMPGHMQEEDSESGENSESVNTVAKSTLIDHNAGVGSLNAGVAGSLACYLLKKLLK